MAFTPGATSTYFTSGSGSQNSFAMPIPTHSSGDLLIAVIGTNNPSADVFVPTGWSSPSSTAEQTTGGNSARILWRISDGTEGSTVTVSFNGFFAITAVVHAIAGAHATTPIRVYSFDSGLGGTPTAPSVTGTSGDRRLLMGAYNITGTANTPTGFTKRGDVSGTSSTRTEAALFTENSDLTGGATGTADINNGVFTYWYAFTVTLQPAAAGGTSVNPSVVASTSSVPSATITATAGTSPSTKTSVSSVPSASVSATAGVAASTKISVSSVPSATVTATANPTPAIKTSVSTVPSATVSATGNVTSSVVNSVSSVPSATVTTGVNVLPSTVNSVSSVPAPSLAATGSFSTITSVSSVPAASLSGTGAINPATKISVSTVPAATVSATAATSPATKTTVSNVPAASISATANVTPAVVNTLSSVPGASVTTPSSVQPNTVVSTSSVPSVTVTASANVTPGVVNSVSTIPSGSVSDGTTPSTTGGRYGVTWIDEPWTHWPVDEEALVQ